MAVAIGCSLFFTHNALAETLADALAAAYANNPTLNAQRASLRATDEGVPQALSGYRPTISASADAGITASIGSPTTYPVGVSITIEQPIFLGHRTTNGVKIAETAVLAGREALRNVEQNTLLSAAQAFMGLVRAQAILNLRRENLDFLAEQVRAAEDRLNVGEGTRTDVAQTKARQSSGQADYNAAAAALNTALAVYEQVIGHQPKSLGAANPVDPRLSKTLNAALADAMTSHPSILAAGYNIDIAEFNVKVTEGELLPTVTLSGSLSHRADSGGPGTPSSSAQVVGRLNVPLYSGGEVASKVRQSTEVLGQRRIELDVARDQVRQAVISAWGGLDAARAQIRAAEAQVAAEQLVLSGIIEERKVGQRTTLDVLNAQQELLGARVALVSAQHDRVIASYSLLAAIGRLSAEDLGLNVQRYDPQNHYVQVRDKWGGLRTPDGR
ncbi:MAG: TolC family outer membrane protein [Bauldia sp.]|nr:TolC family outer membrane protein [Bauldia sp.]